jgi:hypothetical protein
MLAVTDFLIDGEVEEEVEVEVEAEVDDEVEDMDNLVVLGEAGEVDLEVDEPASDEGVILSLGLLGPRTLPSFAYSQVRLRRMHRLHEGCSPLHCGRTN